MGFFPIFVRVIIAHNMTRLAFLISAHTDPQQLCRLVKSLPETAQFFIHVDAKSDIKDRKSTRLNSSHANISYAVFCLKKKKIHIYNVMYNTHTYNTNT